MTSPQPTSKRKRTTGPLGNLLHPGEWRGKRARSSSRSGSPADSGVSTPGVSYQSDAFETLLGGAIVPPITGDEHSQSRIAGNNPGGDIMLPPQFAAQWPRDRIPSSTPINSAGGASWAGLEKALQTLRVSAKVCPPLYSAIDGLKSCLNVFEVRKSQDFTPEFSEEDLGDLEKKRVRLH